MQELYIGLMSGTSMDAVDAALVDFKQGLPKLIASHSQPLPTALKNELASLCTPGPNEINRMGELDIQVAALFAQTALQLLEQAKITPQQVQAIGSHGQTIRHQPYAKFPFTLQIGDPNIIAERTGITTIADFRRRDMANGGQGAPLTPAFHQAIFRTADEDRIILNLGGIANVTWLPANTSLPVIGFDTGPANTLLDGWSQQHLHKPCDKNGAWAATGKINHSLLTLLLTDPYFQLSPPKSTGREHFNLTWLTHITAKNNFSLQDETPANIQATLVELTAISIANAIKQLTPSGKILVCGGGMNNTHLISRLKNNCPHHSIHSTAEFGVPAEAMEAMAWAWLAQQTLHGLPSNLPSVTGAKHRVILGGIYQTLLG